MSSPVKEDNPVRPHLCAGHSNEHPRESGGSVQDELDEIEALSKRVEDLSREMERDGVQVKRPKEPHQPTQE